MKKYFDLIRVKHWIKNLLIFLPMVCANMLNSESIFVTVLGFFSFSFMSSFIYIINDIKDVEKDRKHPRKKNRPIASGVVSRKRALVIAFLLLAVSISICVFTANNFVNSLIIILTYMFINVGYSFGLKNIAVLDICLLTCGFVLRVYYGASILHIEVSKWLFLTILSASTFLGLGKRRKELLNTKEARKVLSQYDETFLCNFQYMCLGLTLVFYSLWAIEQKSGYLIYTVPIVILIFMKYCLIVEKSNEGDPTTVLFQDKFLLILCGIYGVIMLALLGSGV